MAGVYFSAVTGEVVTGTSQKTILQLVAATNVRVKVREWSFSFIGTSNTAQPIRCQLMTQTDAGTMSSLTLKKKISTDSETLQTTAQHTATSEPTTGTAFKAEEVHPQTGYTWQAPFGGEEVIVGGARLGFVVTAGATTSVQVRSDCEE